MVTPAQRAKAAHAAAEAADHPHDRAAFKAAAATWERIANGPGPGWSLKDLQGDFRTLQRDFAVATGPFQPPQPPKAPAPSQAPLIAELEHNGSPSARQLAARLRQEATIEF